MIDWRAFNNSDGIACWGGWISGRPLYCIETTATGFALYDLAVGPKLIMSMNGPAAFGELQALAEKHRHEFTGGLFP